MHSCVRACTLIVSLALAGLPVAASGQIADVQQIVRRYEAALPARESLAFFTLDWTADLAEARERAQREQRPIFFIYVTNISADTNFYGGHC